MAAKMSDQSTTEKRSRTFGESDEMRRDRIYEEKVAGYYWGARTPLYAKSDEELEEMGRELPDWDILPS